MPGDVLNAKHPATANRQAVDAVSGVAAGAGNAGTSAVTRTVVAAGASVTLKVANANRIGLAVYNNAITNLFLKLGAVASITAGVESFTTRLLPNAYYEVPFGYTGIVEGIWDAADANGEALVTELTA
jgi:hypothetical protein